MVAKHFPGNQEKPYTFRNVIDIREWKVMQDKGVMPLSRHLSELRRPATPVGICDMAYLFWLIVKTDAKISKNRMRTRNIPS